MEAFDPEHIQKMHDMFFFTIWTDFLNADYAHLVRLREIKSVHHWKHRHDGLQSQISELDDKFDLLIRKMADKRTELQWKLHEATEKMKEAIEKAEERVEKRYEKHPGAFVEPRELPEENQ